MSGGTMEWVYVSDDGYVTLQFRARQHFGVWWSRDAVTRTAWSMLGAWRAIAERETKRADAP